MDQPDIFEAAIYIRRPCWTPGWLAVGSVNVEIERRSSHELASISVLTICKQKKQIATPAAVQGEKKEEIKHVFSFLPQRRYVQNFRLFFQSNRFEKKKNELRVSIYIGLQARPLVLSLFDVFCRIRYLAVQRCGSGL